ncbi:hypothetical protein ABZT06_16550 [Streptomyces sp. NPDC005483]|uniref:hypothetical protein n=1 Tax=Streptomyces sp. NPDC005483 TaxID=3154882 RepID=UPI0033BA9267
MTRAVMVNGLSVNGSWYATGTGAEVVSVPLSGDGLRLRAAADIRPGAARPGTFSYSTLFH